MPVLCNRNCCSGWRERTTNTQRLVKRAHIILEGLKGTSNSSIAQYVHIDYATVRGFRDRWHAAESRVQAILRDRKAETAQSCISRILLEERFSHPRHAGGIRFLRGEYKKGQEHTRSAGVAAHYAMPRAGKQEEGALRERSCRQHPVGRRGRRVVFATQDQRGNGAGDGLPLHSFHWLDVPELAIRVIRLQRREKVMPRLWFHHLHSGRHGLRGEVQGRPFAVRGRSTGRSHQPTAVRPPGPRAGSWALSLASPLAQPVEMRQVSSQGFHEGVWQREHPVPREFLVEAVMCRTSHLSRLYSSSA